MTTRRLLRQKVAAKGALLLVILGDLACASSVLGAGGDAGGDACNGSQWGLVLVLGDVHDCGRRWLRIYAYREILLLLLSLLA